jgi:hypothetical protein
MYHHTEIEPFGEETYGMMLGYSIEPFYSQMIHNEGHGLGLFAVQLQMGDQLHRFHQPTGVVIPWEKPEGYVSIFLFPVTIQHAHFCVLVPFCCQCCPAM